MTHEELNYIKDAFSQIIDDIAGNPDWQDAARAIASNLGTLERELEKKVYVQNGIIMTKEETLSNLKAYLDGDTAIGNIIPLRSVLESAIKYLSEPSLLSNLDEVAEEWCKKNNKGIALSSDKKSHYLAEGMEAFKACAEWMAGQFLLVEGEPTGWFRANDGSEYATGLDLKEPIKLPVDFYVKKK